MIQYLHIICFYPYNQLRVKIDILNTKINIRHFKDVSNNRGDIGMVILIGFNFFVGV